MSASVSNMRTRRFVRNSRRFQSRNVKRRKCVTSTLSILMLQRNADISRSVRLFHMPRGVASGRRSNIARKRSHSRSVVSTRLSIGVPKIRPLSIVNTRRL